MQTKLNTMLETTIHGLGYELVDVTISPAKLVTVFIDKPGGINLADCEKVSNHLVKLFAVEEIDFGRLEISSPGLERPLKTLADFARYKSKMAKIKTHTAIDGLKVFHGSISEVSDTAVTLHLADETTVTIEVSDINRARLVFDKFVKGK